MNADALTFGIKDVVGIIIGVLGIIAFIYAIKRTAEKAQDSNEMTKAEVAALRREMDEKFLHAKNSKKANIQMIMDTIQQTKEEVEKKEVQIYSRLNEVREEQKDAHDRLSTKLDSVVEMQQKINLSIAELTGFLRGKQGGKPTKD